MLLEQEALAALGLLGADLVGSSFGGMLACELQATFPGMFGKLVVLDPIGLWRDDTPGRELAHGRPAGPSRRMLFADPSSPGAQAMFTLPEDHAQMADAIAAMTWAMGCTAKFVWPVPDRGLDRRLHRITAPTLVIWGKEDALVSSVYAEEFGSRIAGARVEVLEGCGHVPQVEKQAETLALVRGFLS